MTTALEAANRAMSGRRTREATRFASIELREVDPRAEVWEFAAGVCVATAALLFVIGAWLY